MFHFTINRRTPRVLFVMGVLLRAGNAWAFNSPDYFPLTPGISWTYTNSTVTVSGTQTVNGVLTTVLQSSNGGRTYNTSDATKGILLHQQFTPNVQGSISLTITFSLPIVLANASANVGDSVPSNGIAHFAFSCGGTADLPYTATFNVTGMADVTVPAGTFANVVQLDGTIHITGGQTTCFGSTITIPTQDLLFSFFLALNIGTVKLSATTPSGSTTGELTASNILLPSVSPTSWNYGNIESGGGTSDKSFTVQNSGPATLNGSVTLLPPAGSDFTILSGGGAFSLAPNPNGNTSVTVRFAPTSLGAKNATLRVSSSDNPNVNPKDVPLSGTGTTHTLAISDPSGLPNPVASGGTASLSVAATDSLGHALTYTWTATCPTLSSNGSPIPAGSNTTWAAPSNTTGSQQSCTIQVTVSDGQGLSQPGSYQQGVNTQVVVAPEPLVPQVLNVTMGTGSEGDEQKTFLTTDPITVGATYYDPNPTCVGVEPVVRQLLFFNLEEQLILTREDVSSSQLASGSKYQVLSLSLAPGALPAGAYNLIFLVRDCTNVSSFVSGFYPIVVFTP